MNEQANKTNWEFLKNFVRNLDINEMELDPKEASLNEIASVGTLLQIHAEASYSRVKVVKAKAELDKDAEVFKQFQDGAFDKELPKGEKVKRLIKSERVAKVNQDIEAGEQYAVLMVIRPHAHEQADFLAVGFWQDTVLTFLKEQVLNFILGVLRGLVKDAIPAMVDFANNALGWLEERIIDLYNKANEEERRIFKENLTKYFPNSQILNKLN